MNYIDIYKNDTTNGPGVRVVLWVSGCSHHCKECHNPQTWDENAGNYFDKTAKKDLFDALAKPYIKGITFSGGDPLYSTNVLTILELVTEIREKFPQKDIWLYTGYTYEDLMEINSPQMNIRREILKNIDVLIDGEFIIDKKDLRLKWRGSSNQRVIDMPKTLLENKICLKDI